MSKRGPLSKIEKFYIEENLDLGVDALAKELDRAKSVIKAYSKKIVKPKIAENTTPSNENIVSNKRGSTVMTETGSMISDDFRSNRIIKDSKRPGCVAPIK